MKFKIVFLSMVLFMLGACSHHHGHNSAHDNAHSHHHSDSKMTLNNGQKWKADEVLSRNMNSIHDDLHGLMKKEAAHKVRSEDYEQFHNKVQKATEEIITKCQMSPEMDATYHVILEEVLAANEDLKDSKKQKNATKRFAKAFHLYDQYFK